MSATQIWVVFHRTLCNPLPSGEVTKHGRVDLLLLEVAELGPTQDDLEAGGFCR
jgi:hypothetical protein